MSGDWVSAADIFVASIFVIFLIVISIIDLLRGMIYNKILLPMAVIAIIFDFTGYLIQIDEAIIAAFLGGILLYIVQIISHGGLGGGDVKFAFVLGLWLGTNGILIALFMSTIFASIAGVIILIKRKNLNLAIPFGPFMSFGALVTFFFKFQLLTLYDNLFKICL